MAHEMGRPSIALAQAFCSYGKLEQKDVIGEWVPKSEPGESDVLSAIEKWLRGIRWEEIDENLVLRHPTSRDGKIVELNLQEIPELLAEIRLKPRPKKDRSSFRNIPNGHTCKTRFETIGARLPWRRVSPRTLGSCGVADCGGAIGPSLRTPGNPFRTRLNEEASINIR